MKDREWERLLNHGPFVSLMRKVFSIRVESGEDFGSDEWLLRETRLGESSWLWSMMEKVNSEESKKELKDRFIGIDAWAAAVVFMRLRKRTYREASKGKPMPKAPMGLFR
jgi:hypothetical protein